ncbi:hypothetical protein LAV79_29210 [Peribacillus butanolivorans]|uniref:hypothetical protein n=1 Tax=Peribacillus butanolivorans TaxID=421767 RepID=UPI0030C97056
MRAGVDADDAGDAGVTASAITGWFTTVYNKVISMGYLRVALFLLSYRTNAPVSSIRKAILIKKSRPLMEQRK